MWTRVSTFLSSIFSYFHRILSAAVNYPFSGSIFSSRSLISRVYILRECACVHPRLPLSSLAGTWTYYEYLYLYMLKSRISNSFRSYVQIGLSFLPFTMRRNSSSSASLPTYFHMKYWRGGVWLIDATKTALYEWLKTNKRKATVCLLIEV